MSKKTEETNQTQHIYRKKTDKRILKKNPWKDYRLHITVLVLVIIAEMIGPIDIKLTKDVTVSIMPLLYTMVLGLVFYLAKPIKWIERKQSRVAEGAMMLFIGVLIAKLAISSGQSMHLLFEMGPALLLQELEGVPGLEWISVSKLVWERSAFDKRISSLSSPVRISPSPHAGGR